MSNQLDLLALKEIFFKDQTNVALTSIIGVRRICQGPPPRANRVGESIRGGFSLVHCVYLSGPMQYVGLKLNLLKVPLTLTVINLPLDM